MRTLIAIVLTNAVWIFFYWRMRSRYRALLNDAIGILRDVKNVQFRRYVLGDQIVEVLARLEKVIKPKSNS